MIRGAVNADLEAVASVAAYTAHDFLGELYPVQAGFFQKDAVVDQHDWHDASVAQPHGRQPQHLGAPGLHREVV